MKMQRIGMLAAPFLLLLALGTLTTTNAKAYWSQGQWGYQGWQGWRGQSWQWNSYRYSSAYIWDSGYRAGYSDAQSGLTQDCGDHSLTYCQTYNQGFKAYSNINTNIEQTQSTEVNIRGNNNIVGMTQEQGQSNGIGSGYPADGNENDNGYYPSPSGGYNGQKS